MCFSPLKYMYFTKTQMCFPHQKHKCVFLPKNANVFSSPKHKIEYIFIIISPKQKHTSMLPSFLIIIIGFYPTPFTHRYIVLITELMTSGTLKLYLKRFKVDYCIVKMLPI